MNPTLNPEELKKLLDSKNVVLKAWKESGGRVE
jgi:hypothetical protein